MTISEYMQTFQKQQERETGFYRCQRGLLPRPGFQGSIYFVTTRLIDSVPDDVQSQWRMKLAAIDLMNPIMPTKLTDLKINLLRTIGDYLDKGYGECLLRLPEIARIVAETIRIYDGEEYNLLAWSIMPNHLHLVLQVIAHARNREGKLERIVNLIKNYSARHINLTLNRTGKIWMNDYYDLCIRTQNHLINAVTYIMNHPRQLGLSTDYTSCIFDDVQPEPASSCDRQHNTLLWDSQACTANDINLIIS